MKWFKHDADASIDAKLQELLLDYGATGYGLYWYCVELIAKNVKTTNITFELEHDVRIIAKNLNLTIQETSDMMQKMVDLGLFDLTVNKKLACINLAYRLDDSMRKGKQVEEIVNKFKESGKSREIPNESGKSHLELDTELDTELDIDTEEAIDANASIVSNGKSVPDCPHQEIINLYLKNLPTGINPRSWDGSRASALKSRWREKPERRDLAWWDKFFSFISESQFLTGKVQSQGRKSFEITLPWILKKENFDKIVDGVYH